MAPALSHEMWCQAQHAALLGLNSHVAQQLQGPHGPFHHECSTLDILQKLPKCQVLLRGPTLRVDGV